MGFDIQVENLDEFRKGLKQLGGRDLQKEMGKANKDVGRRIIALSEGRQRRLAGRWGSYRSRVVKVRPSASQRRLQITVRPGAAERGARRHPVFGRWMDQSSFSRRVWPREVRGEGGYLVRPTVLENIDEVGEIYIDTIGRFARRVIGG